MPWPDIALKVDRADVVEIRPGGLPVDRALVELGVLARRGVDGIDVDDGHLLVENFGPGLHQLAGLAV